MKATILPLMGKYYGTEVEIDFGDGYSETIKLWDSANYIPSSRWLQKFGFTLDQWQENKPNVFGERPKDIVGITDGHFESDVTYQRAIKLAQKINGSLVDRSRDLTLLYDFMLHMEKNGYVDSDWRNEPPSPIDRFMKNR